jgi:hypothetical protein
MGGKRLLYLLTLLNLSTAIIFSGCGRRTGGQNGVSQSKGAPDKAELITDFDGDERSIKLGGVENKAKLHVRIDGEKDAENDTFIDIHLQVKGARERIAVFPRLFVGHLHSDEMAVVQELERFWRDEKSNISLNIVDEGAENGRLFEATSKLKAEEISRTVKFRAVKGTGSKSPYFYLQKS